MPDAPLIEAAPLEPMGTSELGAPPFALLEVEALSAGPQPSQQMAALTATTRRRRARMARVGCTRPRPK
jgi:hypothetical protein